MKLAVKKGLELDAKVQQIIDEEFADFEKYLATLQEKRMYQRKRKEYWENVNMKLEEINGNGRTDETVAGN